MGVDKTKNRAEMFFTLMVETYSKLGFEVDQVKTLFSTIKYTYLNQVYADGAQACFALETYLKSDVERKTRFADVFQRIASVYGSFLGASKAGFDPWAAYIAATHLALRYLRQRVNDVQLMKPEAAAMCMLIPRSQGGRLGISCNHRLAWKRAPGRDLGVESHSV